jgi:hypothetical protein
MNTNPITEYSPKALKNISKQLKFSAWENEKVLKHVTFSSYIELNHAISSIFSAIETIGFNGEKSDLGLCAGLAIIGRKLLPTDELEFLDDLLIKDEISNPAKNFKEIENL